MNVEDIVQKLKAAENAYEEGNPIMSDAAYDLLREELVEICPHHPHLLQVGSQVRGTNTPLPMRMASLDQIACGAIPSWLSPIELKEAPWVITDKLDGTSLMLTYSSGKFKSAFSRGNGAEGHDVTRHAQHLKGVIKDLGDNELDIIIRAEVVVPFADFYSHEISEAFKNPRNWVAGKMNSKDTDSTFTELAEVVSYEIMYPENMPKASQLEVLQSLGFILPQWEVMVGTEMTDEVLCEVIDRRRAASKFELDGIVMTADDETSRAYLAENHTASNKNPSHSVKYKKPNEAKLTTVKSVEWNVSKTKYIKPTVIFEDIELSGATVQRATGFNAKYIVDNNIGPGAKIAVVRSGDVIPYITDIIEGTSPQLPEEGTYEWVTEVDIIALEVDEKHDILVLTDQFSLLKIDSFRRGNVTKMYESGYKTFWDIISAPREAFTSSIGAAHGNDIYDAVQEKIRQLNELQIVVVSGVLGRGIAARKLEKFYEKNDTILGATRSQLEETEGFGGVIVEQILEKMNDLYAFFARWEEFGLPVIHEKIEKKIAKSGTIVFTGFRDAELKEILEAQGYLVSTSVNKETVLLITKDVTKISGKTKTAQKMGIEIISIEEATKRWLKN